MKFPIPSEVDIYSAVPFYKECYGSAKYIPKHSKRIKNKKRKAQNKKK